MKCQACEEGDHDNCGMQTWCDCDCEGYDPNIPAGSYFIDDLDGGRLVKQEKAMSVRAKVRCNAKSGNEVHFTTVYEPDGSKNDENARFTKASPWGDIRMGIDNPAAMEKFEVNKEYYVDFTPAG
jgi:hypothetical protein